MYGTRPSLLDASSGVGRHSLDACSDCHLHAAARRLLEVTCRGIVLAASRQCILPHTPPRHLSHSCPPHKTTPPPRPSTSVSILPLLLRSFTRHGSLSFLIEGCTFFCGYDILDSAVGRLALPWWFRRTYFRNHASVRFRFMLAGGLGMAWTFDGGIPPRLPPEHGLLCRLVCPLV